jgi:hypothetical protein
MSENEKVKADGQQAKPAENQTEGRQPGDFPAGGETEAADVTLYDSRIGDVETKLQKVVDGLAKHGIKIAL